MAASVAPVFQGDTAWPLSLPIVVLGTLYLFWGVVLVGLAVLIFIRRTDRARRGQGHHGREGGFVRWALITACAYQGTLWALRLAYRSTYAQGLWLRDGILTGLFLATVAILGRCIKS